MNLERVYKLIETREDELHKYYDIDTYSELYAEILNEVGLPNNSESKLAIATRVVSLRDDMIYQVMKNASFSSDKIDITKEIIFKFVRDIHLQLHSRLIESIENENLLSEFYLKYIKGIHKIGIEFTNWQIAWNREILLNINPKLLKEFDSNEKAIFKFLDDNSLIDLGHNKELGDRSYSILKCLGDRSYKSIAYIDAFSEIEDIIREIENLKTDLEQLNDDVFNKKSEILKYLQSLIDAFSQRDVNELISKWADVDRAWMDIDIPIQLAHPLEYYEDHFRKAVAPEFDVRIKNPNIKNERIKNIKLMYKEIYSRLSKDDRLLNLTLSNLEKVQLYIGRVMLYYGAEFNGLFSAQVVPNDEVVTSERGKKIFAFPDSILNSSRAKPFMLLPKLIFGEEFVKESRRFLFNEDTKWHKLYDITTIGHEFGHILWVDNDSESVMNKSGNYKNIEEFKATTGGLVSFFLNEEDGLQIELLRDTITRAVSLISWMEVDEVKPYYCEGLIHLNILFASDVLSFKGEKFTFDLSIDAYNRAKEKYIDVYTSLALHYIQKRDASEFLEQYCIKDALNYMPKDNEVRKFVEYYYELYRIKGRELDSDSKNDYITQS